MKKTFIMLFGVFFFLFSSIVCAADRPILDIEGRYWFPKLSTDWKVGNNATDVDDGTLGLSNKNFVNIRATVNILENHSIRLEYTPIRYSGDATMTQNVVFGGKTYAAGNLVSTDLKMDYLRAGWLWHVVNQGNIKFSTLLDIKGFFIKSELSAPAQALSYKYTVNAALPAIGGVLTISPAKAVDLFVEASGIYIGSERYIYDAEAGVKFTFIKSLSIKGGYKAFELKFKDGSDQAKFAMAGPFAGLTFSF